MGSFPQILCVSAAWRQLLVWSDGGNFQAAVRSSLYLLGQWRRYAGSKLVWALRTAQVPQLADTDRLGH